MEAFKGSMDFSAGLLHYNMVMILWDRATGLGIKVMCSDVKLQVVMVCVKDPLDRKYNLLGYRLLGDL